MTSTKTSIALRKKLLDITISTLFDTEGVVRVHLCTLVLPEGAKEALWFAPMEHVKNGTFTINISPSAIGGFAMDEYLTTIQASFNGRPTRLDIPTGLIIGVIGYDAQGEVVGMENFIPFLAVPDDAKASPDASQPSPEKTAATPQRPSFGVIDGGKSESNAESGSAGGGEHIKRVH